MVELDALSAWTLRVLTAASVAEVLRLPLAKGRAKRRARGRVLAGAARGA